MVYIKILIKYPSDFDKKNVCTPNINIATIPLKIPIYFAPTIPIDVLRKTEKGMPCFCDGPPIKLEKKATSKAADNDPQKTIAILNFKTR